MGEFFKTVWWYIVALVQREPTHQNAVEDPLGEKKLWRLVAAALITEDERVFVRWMIRAALMSIGSETGSS